MKSPGTFPAAFAIALFFGLALLRPAAAQDYSFTTFAGEIGNDSRDGAGTAARFVRPIGIAVDAGGTLYVADAGSHAIRKISPSGVVTTFAGLAGRRGRADGTGSAARFNEPEGVAVDGSGNVYVADTGNNTIRKISPGGVVTTLAGSPGYGGSTDGTGGAARFSSPYDVAVDATGTVYVADTYNNMIRRITAFGVVTTVAANLDYPRGVAVDGSGNLFVADPYNYLIRKITPSGAVSTYPNLDTYFDIRDVAVDASGNVFVGGGAESWDLRVHKVTPGGVVTPLAGSGNPGNADGAGSTAEFGGQLGVAVDASGNVFVADSANQTIRKITAGGIVTTLAGARDNGSNDGVGSAARFQSPNGVAVDAGGNLFVADTYNATIRKVTPAGLVTTVAGAPDQGGSADGAGSAARFSYPHGVAVDASGTVYLADTNHTIRKISPDGAVTTLAGLADSAGSADGPGGTARFNHPIGVAVDAGGNVFVADTDNGTIRKITPAGVVTTFAGAPGQRGSADGAGSVARFNYPTGLAVDASGTLFVADLYAHTIRKITPDGVVTTLAGLNQSGSADGTGSAARFNNQRAVAVDAGGNVFVADTDNHTIRRIGANGFVSTVAGSVGRRGNANGAGSAARFHNPLGLAVDASGSLFVVESGSNAIRKGVPVPPIAPAIVAQPQGQTVARGRTVALHAAASGSPAPSYQWTRNGVALAGATDATLILANTTAASAGTYQCITSNLAGSIASDAVALAIVDPPDVGRINNFSVRANLVGGERLIAGLVVSGGSKLVLTRVIGPGLQPFLPPDAVLAGDPRLELYDGTGAILDGNENWGGGATLRDAFTAVGAFPLADTSADAALLRNLNAAHTVHALATATGIGLVEFYDAAASIGSSRFSNFSARGEVRVSDDVLIAGFVLEGSTSQTVLVRDIGPGLAPFKVPFTLEDPRLEIFNAAQQKIAGFDDWSSNLASIAAQIGAFALPARSLDAAVLLTLPPGLYTAVLSGAENDIGEGLIEIYDVQ